MTGKAWAHSWGESFARTQRRTATSIMLKHGLGYWLLLWNLPTYLHVRRVIAETTTMLKGIGCEWQGETESKPPILLRYGTGLDWPKLGIFSSGREAKNARSQIH